MTKRSFPRIKARDLDGREVMLPTGLAGEWNVVIIAFRRQQQAMVDSWVPWLRDLAEATPGLGFAEVPAIGLAWQPVRSAIDGGMAASIADQQTRRRTLTVYTDLRRLTGPLGIADRNSIWLFLTDRDGQVRWHGTGGWDATTAADLAAALAGPGGSGTGTRHAAVAGSGQFEMAFDRRFRLPLAALGITPATSHVSISPDLLIACLGPWTCHTAPANVRQVCVTGPYRAYRAIGPRLSLADHGLTFGTTIRRGVCLLFDEPVTGIDPFGVLRHPGLTLTVAETERFAATVRDYAGLSAPPEAVVPPA